MPRIRSFILGVLGLTVAYTVRNIVSRVDSESSSDLRQFIEPRICIPKVINISGKVRSPSFQQQIIHGRLTAKDQGVIMGGLVRDIGGTTKRLFSALHGVGSVFAFYHIVVLENDSKDKTREALTRECSRAQVTCESTWPTRCYFRKNSMVSELTSCCTCDLLTLPEMGKSVQTTSMGIFASHRIARLTKIRNMLLFRIREISRRNRVLGRDFNFVLLFDGDMFTAGSHGFNPSTVHAMLGLETRHQYDVICGNQIVGDGMYRDVFGLRFDSFDETPVNPAGMKRGDKIWFSGLDIVPVTSCFSGLALYTAATLLGDYRTSIAGGTGNSTWIDAQCVYRFEDEQVCEHVGLHRCLAANGMARFGIYPPMAVRMNQVRAESLYDPSLHEAFIEGDRNQKHPVLAAEECAPVSI